MPEFVFALEADGMRMGKIKDDLPLFCTLFHFRRECDAERILMETCEVIQSFRPIALFSEKAVLVGPNRRMPAHLIRKTAPLQKLHDAVCGVQLARSAAPVHPDWIGEGYCPHVVDRGERCLRAGTGYVSNYVTLYERVAGEPLTLSAFSNIKLG